MILQTIAIILQLMLSVLCGLAIGYHFTTRKMVGTVLKRLQDVLDELTKVINLNQKVNEQDKTLIKNIEDIYKGVYHEVRFVRQNMVRRKVPIIDE